MEIDSVTGGILLSAAAAALDGGFTGVSCMFGWSRVECLPAKEEEDWGRTGV